MFSGLPTTTKLENLNILIGVKNLYPTCNHMNGMLMLLTDHGGDIWHGFYH